ncbi:Protein NAP1 [Dendrobium catenatum]|uniref:Protein NAP1 n=1 Tax=Dendrobium catenatum TaxID=906689 RepID=A0A2I0WTW2_9ASPA|nr:Protein NAP1 [Dendrobium catenatum]
MINEVHDLAIISCDGIHRERRILLKQETGRMAYFLADQPSLLVPNIQMVFSALALAQYKAPSYSAPNFSMINTAAFRSVFWEALS